MMNIEHVDEGEDEDEDDGDGDVDVDDDECEDDDEEEDDDEGDDSPGDLFLQSYVIAAVPFATTLARSRLDMFLT